MISYNRLVSGFAGELPEMSGINEESTDAKNGI